MSGRPPRIPFKQTRYLRRMARKRQGEGFGVLAMPDPCRFRGNGRAASWEQTSRARVFHAGGRHPPFNTAPVADSQRSCDPLFKRAHARIAKGDGLIVLLNSEGTRNREYRNSTTDASARPGGACDRYRNRRITHDHGTFRRPAGRGEPVEPGHCDRPAAGPPALDRSRDYPGSAARKPVCRIPARYRGGATALGTRHLERDDFSSNRHPALAF
jgi:hypothetical protein